MKEIIMNDLRGPFYYVKLLLPNYAFTVILGAAPSLDSIMFAMVRVLSSESDVYQAFHQAYSAVSGEKKCTPLLPREYHFGQGLEVYIESVPFIGA